MRLKPDYQLIPIGILICGLIPQVLESVKLPENPDIFVHEFLKAMSTLQIPFATLRLGFGYQPLQNSPASPTLAHTQLLLFITDGKKGINPLTPPTHPLSTPKIAKFPDEPRFLKWMFPPSTFRYWEEQMGAYSQ
jgi:hypothetical protein